MLDEEDGTCDLNPSARVFSFRGLVVIIYEPRSNDLRLLSLGACAIAETSTMSRTSSRNSKSQTGSGANFSGLCIRLRKHQLQGHPKASNGRKTGTMLVGMMKTRRAAPGYFVWLKREDDSFQKRLKEELDKMEVKK